MANALSNCVTALLQRFLVPHLGALTVAGGEAFTLADPRSPVRFRLEILARTFEAQGQVTILPGAAFLFPGASGWRAGRCGSRSQAPREDYPRMQMSSSSVASESGSGYGA